MTPPLQPGFTSDPAYVYKRFGYWMMAIGVVVILIDSTALAFGKISIDADDRFLLIFLIAAFVTPFAIGFALVSDWFRRLLLTLADRIPLIKFQKAPEPPTT